MLLERREVLVDVGVDAEVDDLEAGALHHHRRQVLADVVDVALDGADHDLADRLGAGLGQQRPQEFHAGLHRVGGEQHLGHEQDAVAEVDADDAHALDERVVEHLVGAPAAVEQDGGALDDLVGEAVVEIVVHLLDQLVVGQRGEVDLVVVVVTHDVPHGMRPGIRPSDSGFHHAERIRIVEHYHEHAAPSPPEPESPSIAGRWPPRPRVTRSAVGR